MYSFDILKRLHGLDLEIESKLVPQFNRIDSINWILTNIPRFIDHCNIAALKSRELSIVLSEHPALVNNVMLERLTPMDLSYLLSKHPQLVCHVQVDLFDN